ncbi:antibiotic biosynthesis monooxygenase family protein [Maritalea mediterranea]|uniref:ABM domain-containing protein n=1 Tax=Maritalea mediterranea TaxID=2909667 RepID=A0ABS9E6H1_9HYPH|nr:hypothetical protein [Maritalea mediterranea]MCF4097499.1 hypothetical protein [Maritalea mediterranea]
MSHVFELVSFTVKNGDNALAKRREAMEHAKKLKGFVRYHALVNTEDNKHFADLVEWASLEDAQAAAEKVMTLPAFQGMMAEIDSVESMKHFNIDKIAE